MAEILHFEILRKHGQTNTHTNKQTDMGITIPRPPPMGGRGNEGNACLSRHSSSPPGVSGSFINPQGAKVRI